MGRKNVVAIDSNVTPEQKRVIEEWARGNEMTPAELIREAVREWIERQGGEWPEGDVKHGGYRPPKNRGVND